MVLPVLAALSLVHPAFGLAPDDIEPDPAMQARMKAKADEWQKKALETRRCAPLSRGRRSPDDQRVFGRHRSRASSASPSSAIF